MSETSDVAGQIQGLIKAERKRLLDERESLKAKTKANWDAMRALQRQCAHPNKIHGTLHGCATEDCPDCGFGTLQIGEHIPQRGRRKK